MKAEDFIKQVYNDPSDAFKITTEEIVERLVEMTATELERLNERLDRIERTYARKPVVYGR